jgi:hypothetical protein
VMRGRRPTRFYEFADRLLRDEVELARMKRGGSKEEAQVELRGRIQSARESLYATVGALEQ